jgi:hypothetical protein
MNDSHFGYKQKFLIKTLERFGHSHPIFSGNPFPNPSLKKGGQGEPTPKFLWVF